MSMRLGIGLGLSYRGAAGSAPASAAMLMLAGETDGLALDFSATSSPSGSAAVKDTGTPANDFDGAPQDLLVYSGSSAKWVYNSAGVLVENPAGTLPIDHDPVTLARKGLLVEEQRTNLILNNAAMSTQNVTVSATAYTLSFWGTGTVTLSGTSTAGPLVGTGANDRVALTFTPTAGTLTLTVSGTVTRGQLEAGPYATSPIPTTSVAVTRAADNITLATSAFPYSAAAGTLYAECETINENAVGGKLVQASNAGANRIAQYIGSNYFGLIVTDGGVNQAVIAPAVANELAFHQNRSAYEANNFACSLDGAAVLTDTSGTIPSTIDTLRIGRQVTHYLDSHIKRLVYVPRRVSNANLPTWQEAA